MTTQSLPRAYREAVTSNRWFADLPAATRDAIVSHGQRRTFHTGQYVFRSGMASNGIYCVVDGTVQVGSTSASGRESIIDLYGPGSWIGEATALVRLPRSYDAKAVGRAELLHLPQSDLDRLLTSQPALVRALLRLEASRVRLLLSALNAYAAQTIEQRLASRVLLLVESHGAREEAGWLIRVPLSQDVLAKLVGVTRQRVNQILNSWREQGLVELGRRRLLVIDRAALERLTAG